jgi:hypothetical protein
MLPPWSSVATRPIRAVFEYSARMPITSYCFRTRYPLDLLNEILTRMEQYPAAKVRLKAEGNHWRRSELS